MTQTLAITLENCEYRGEGNAALVIRLKKEEKVLRLLKHDNSVQVKVSAKDVLKDLERQVEMVETVMKCLLGEDMVHCPIIVPLRVEEIKMINIAVNRFRPAHRMHKSVKETDTYVLMLPDYCSLPPCLSVYASVGPVISVEIKPKQGFIEKGNYAPSSHSSKAVMCRFCMMQFYKMKKGVTSKRSGYCPMDLFSGCPVRMQHALKKLLETPQNNFRIFKDQELVYSEEQKDDLCDILAGFFDFQGRKIYSEMLCKLIIQALLKSVSTVSCKSGQDYTTSIKKTCVNAHMGCSQKGCHDLPLGCVLDRILNIQQLDALDITDLYKLFLELKEITQEQCSGYVGCLSQSQLPLFLGEPKKMPAENRYQFASRKVWEFLIALTLKDCSLMLVFKRLAPSFNSKLKQNVISDEHGNFYLFSIAIADLDSKSISKVEKVFHDSRLILESCSDSTNKGRDIIM